MYNFTIFNKKGMVLYMEGDKLFFLNDLIISIDPTKLTGSKRIRDDIMEYQIIDQIVYLVVNRRSILNDKITKFKRIVDKLKENEKITEETINKVNDNDVPNTTDTKEKDLLDFSDRSTKMGSIISSMKKMDIKKTFSIFRNKIEIGKLGICMVEHLIKKNVDSVYSKLITDDVLAECKSLGEEYINEDEFKSRMVKVLRNLLPTISSDDLLNKIRKHGVGYTICFVGVNGVGKTTSLAKTACWLMKNGLRVYIAACDTFRAGAIEQLKIHVQRFKVSGHEVGFYESGYSRDDSLVAKAAIKKAIKENYDVILIDTAGRMHKRENLMQSLSKIIKINSPDHIIFVGEALIGSDSVEHIKEFNKWINEGEDGRKIDSIILTKVDTVEDKIGQVINLSFTASAPILFLGVGQTNSDLQPMDPSNIGELLTS